MKTTKGNQQGRGSERGFTLIEVMIASGILSFEILAVIAMFASSMRMNAFSQKLTNASSLAQGRLEQAKNTPYINLSLPLGADREYISGTGLVAHFDRDLNALNMSVPAEAERTVYTRTLSLQADAPVPGMTVATARVFWVDDSGNDHGVELVSAISRF